MQVVALLLVFFFTSYSVPLSAEGRVEHQKLNQTVQKGRLVEFLVFKSISHVGKKVFRLARKTV